MHKNENALSEVISTQSLCTDTFKTPFQFTLLHSNKFLSDQSPTVLRRYSESNLNVHSYLQDFKCSCRFLLHISLIFFPKNMYSLENEA